MVMANALFFVGAATVGVGLLGTRVSESLARRRSLILVAGLVVVVVGIVLHPEFLAGLRHGMSSQAAVWQS